MRLVLRAVVTTALSLSINHKVDVIGIGGPLIKTMIVDPRQLINTEEN